MAPKKGSRIVFSNKELSWVHRDAEISPHLYFDIFRPNSQNNHEEHQRYAQLLRKVDIDQDYREKLLREFDDWKPEPEDLDGDNAEEDSFNDEEVSGLLANITKAQHPACTWKSGDTCIACLFQQYQREYVQALQDNGLRKANIADVMAIIGVFAPFLPTDRMRRTFEPSILGHLVKSPDLPDPGIDDAAVVKAVRLRMNNKHEEASEAIGKVERTIRLLFDNLST
ncbi:MAG: hypothetical protein J3R72DRAFT_425742 [Linnemannia gamsii]|nr:MAG: hypothetical protein J3R72DRAFT_425742 [Linnemannia gamsii]